MKNSSKTSKKKEKVKVSKIKINKRKLIIALIIAAVVLCIAGSPLGPMILDVLVWIGEAVIWVLDAVVIWVLDIIIKGLIWLKNLTGFFGRFDVLAMGGVI